MSWQSIRNLKSRQQEKDEKINYLLADIEKNLEEYKIALKTKERQLSDAKKILFSAKQSYDKTAAENRDLKAYIHNLKHIQQQQVQFLEKQKNCYQPKKYKKVVYHEETESEPKFEEEEQEETESKVIEKK